ncbi:MAG TPA: nitroreductase/quinone reductase family protein [Iamia sp.]|nr:nitroreductase/quinone reductase family protein [Iamia sp.]
MTATIPTAPRYLAPTDWGTRVTNRIAGALTRRGLSVAGSRELRVVGRTSGEIRTNVVNLLEVDGHRYLVAPRGHTQWVRNLRAAGRGELRVGRRVEAFRSLELPDDDHKVVVIRAYLDRWAWEVGRFFEGIDATSPEDVLLAAAPDFPVFLVEDAA